MNALLLRVKIVGTGGPLPPLPAWTLVCQFDATASIRWGKASWGSERPVLKWRGEEPEIARAAGRFAGRGGITEDVVLGRRLC